jgi:hypothetical protein
MIAWKLRPVLLGYSLKPFGRKDPLGDLLFSLVENAKTVVIEYAPELERAASQVPHIVSRPAVTIRHSSIFTCTTRKSPARPMLPGAFTSLTPVTRPVKLPMENRIARYIWTHTKKPAALDPFGRRRLDDSLFHVVRPAQADRQRADPGQGV